MKGRAVAPLGGLRVRVWAGFGALGRLLVATSQAASAPGRAGRPPQSRPSGPSHLPIFAPGDPQDSHSGSQLSPGLRACASTSASASTARRRRPSPGARGSQLGHPEPLQPSPPVMHPSPAPAKSTPNSSASRLAGSGPSTGDHAALPGLGSMRQAWRPGTGRPDRVGRSLPRRRWRGHR